MLSRTVVDVVEERFSPSMFAEGSKFDLGTTLRYIPEALSYSPVDVSSRSSVEDKFGPPTCSLFSGHIRQETVNSSKSTLFAPRRTGD